MNTLSKIKTNDIIIPSIDIANRLNEQAKKRSLIILQNKRWMRDMVEQRSFLKNNTHTFSVMEHDINDYCYYSDVLEKTT